MQIIFLCLALIIYISLVFAVKFPIDSEGKSLAPLIRSGGIFLGGNACAVINFTAYDRLVSGPGGVIPDTIWLSPADLPVLVILFPVSDRQIWMDLPKKIVYMYLKHRANTKGGWIAAEPCWRERGNN